MPDNATDRTASWTTSNSAVAKVSDGYITASGTGEAMIVANTNDGGYKDTCIVTVIENQMKYEIPKKVMSAVYAVVVVSLSFGRFSCR